MHSHAMASLRAELVVPVSRLANNKIKMERHLPRYKTCLCNANLGTFPDRGLTNFSEKLSLLILLDD